jgi:probable HAF family extracellular repeat protein
MLRTNGTFLSKRRFLGLLPCLFGGVIVAGAVWAGQPQTAAAVALGKPAPATPVTYRVINLGPGIISGAAINASGQVAFSLEESDGDPRNPVSRAWFYDGTTTVDIGTLGGQRITVAGLNNAGQVTGRAVLSGGAVNHAYLWSKRTGMLDLGTLAGVGSSAAFAINNRGQVAGNSDAPNGRIHAFRWTAAAGMEDLGTFPGGHQSSARAINDAGLVAGFSNLANFEPHAFAWTRKTGMVDLGTLGGPGSLAVAVDAEGQVAGESATTGGGTHAFIWNRSRGMKDLGTASASESFTVAMSANGHVVGYIMFPPNGLRHPFSWTRASGIVDIGTLGEGEGDGFARAVNNKGQVVGVGDIPSGDTPSPNRAFLWTAREGMIDLNTRLRHAPRGLVLESGFAINDSGSIVAQSNAGLVLLRPDCGCKGVHTVGPIAADDTVQVGAPFDTSVSFAGADTAARHNVTWSFGDGSGERAGNARAANGAGSASGRHTYTAPGIYTVTAKVVDLAGKSATVSRTIVAYDRSGGGAGGSGWFLSPHGANRIEPGQVGTATFSFVSPSVAGAKASGARAELRFNLGTLSLRSVSLRPVAVQGARAQFEGRATINGKGDYQFTLSTTSGAAKGGGEPGRFGLMVWHTDPATKETVVDYDSQTARR